MRSPLEFIASTSVRPSRLKSLTSTPLVAAAPSSSETISWLPAPAALSQTSAVGTAGRSRGVAAEHQIGSAIGIEVARGHALVGPVGERALRA